MIFEYALPRIYCIYFQSKTFQPKHTVSDVCIRAQLPFYKTSFKIGNLTLMPPLFPAILNIFGCKFIPTVRSINYFSHVRFQIWRAIVVECLSLYVCVCACMSECLYNSLSTKLIFTFERVGRWNWRRSHALLNIMQFEFIHTIIMKIVLLWVSLGLSIVISLKLHLSCSHRHSVNFIISLVALKRTLHYSLPLNFIKSD